MFNRDGFIREGEMKVELGNSIMEIDRIVMSKFWMSFGRSVLMVGEDFFFFLFFSYEGACRSIIIEDVGVVVRLGGIVWYFLGFTVICSLFGWVRVSFRIRFF